jgi:hypothetical protein
MDTDRRDADETPGTIDGLLRAALADDLTEDVRRRLGQRVETFLAHLAVTEPPPGSPPGRPAAAVRRQWSWQRGALAFASSVMVMCGATWHATSSHAAFAQSLSAVQVAIAIDEAVRDAIVHGGGCVANGESAAVAGQESLRDPRELVHRVYRSWAPHRVTTGRDGTLLVTFRDPQTGANVEVLVQADSMLPIEIRIQGPSRPDGGQAAPQSTFACAWSEGPAQPGRPLEGIEP